MFQPTTHARKHYLRPTDTYALLVTCQILPEAAISTPRPSQSPSVRKAKRGRLHASQRWQSRPTDAP